MEKKEKRALATKTLAFFWSHARAYWPMLLLCGVGILIVIGCDIYLPLVFKKFFDQLAIGPLRGSFRNLDEIYQTVWRIAEVMFLSWLGWRAVVWAVIRFESSTMKDLVDYSFGYLQNHSHRFFTDSFGGALVKRINRFAAGFETVADRITLDMGQTCIRIVLFVSIIFWRNTVLGSVFLGWTIAFICFNFYFAKWKLRYDLARAELDTKVTAQLSDTIANAINLKLFAGTKREIGAFKEITENHRRARLKCWLLDWYSGSFQGLFVRALEILVLVLSVGYWVSGVLTLGDFILLRSYLSQLTEEVRMMGDQIRKIYEAIADANEMTEILLKPHEIVDVPNALVLASSKGKVEFRDVSFSYVPAGHMVPQNLNLKIKAGERVGIVGPSGGGKSTILKLLVRLHDVTDGGILIDGQNIAQVTQDSLHQSIAYVPQDPILFHRSLMENIRYSRPDATDDEVICAAKLAHCHEFISCSPDGYDTLVGERGVKLSGGERQRVAIARAILMDAPILVLDEATSSLDSESELFIQDSLAKLVVGRTVIAVAHRLSTIHKMDRIVVVKDGQIIEEGNHSLLLKLQDGVYRKLWNLQSADALEDRVAIQTHLIQ